jgi:hypothetical protein
LEVAGVSTYKSSSILDAAAFVCTGGILLRRYGKEWSFSGKISNIFINLVRLDSQYKKE